MNKFLLSLHLVVIVLLLCLGSALAETFTWTANTEPDVAGYNLYEATGSCANPGAFSKVASFGKVVTGTWTPAINNLYCWQLTAFNSGAVESLPSNRVEKQVTANPPQAPRTLAVH